MYARQLRNATQRLHWTAWTTLIATTSSIATHSTLALCDNNNMADNHLTPLLTKEVMPDEITPIKQKPDVHLQQYSKPENSFLEWGMHTRAKSPKSNNFFEKITLQSVEFSSNVQVALDVDGNLYCKYAQDDWQHVAAFKHIRDVAITNDTLYLVDGKGHLLQWQYHVLPNKYDDPCIDAATSNKMATQRHAAASTSLERDIESCLDHRRKQSFSSMPMANYQQYLTQNYAWKSTAEFAAFLSSQYSSDEFELNDDNARMCGERMRRVFANDYRVFALSESGCVYVRGDNQRGACGVSASELYVGAFTAVDDKYFDAPIVEVGVGEDHTLFVSELGRVFSCGADNCMQLGLGWTKRRAIKSEANWTKSGEQGFAFTARQFDRNSEVEDEKDEEYFHEVPSYDEFYPRVLLGPYFDDYRVVGVACGDYHSAVIVEPIFSVRNALKPHYRKLDHLSAEEWQEMRRDLVDSRRVITWGCGLHGQLGNNNFANASEPKPVKPLEQYKEFNPAAQEVLRIKAIDVKCGKEHTVVLMQGFSESQGSEQEVNKMVFAFGNNRYHQVSPKKKPKCGAPQWIQSILPKYWSVDCVAAGNFQSAAFGHAQHTQYQY